MLGLIFPVGNISPRECFRQGVFHAPGNKAPWREISFIISLSTISKECNDCSSHQQALPIWTPAWPMWMEMTSLMILFGFPFGATSPQCGRQAQPVTHWQSLRKLWRPSAALRMYYLIPAIAIWGEGCRTT